MNFDAQELENGPGKASQKILPRAKNGDRNILKLIDDMREKTFINNRELTLNLIERTEINEIFKIKGENLRLEIARATDTIKGIYKNKVFSVYCIKNSFKM